MTAPAYVRAVLDAHDDVAIDPVTRQWFCTCGVELAEDPFDIGEAHRSHLADVLDGWARGQRAQALRDAAGDFERGTSATWASMRGTWDIATMLRARADREATP